MSGTGGRASRARYRNDAHPRAEVDGIPDLVRALLREQHPDLAEFSIEPVTDGRDNALLSLGEDLCVRMPRRSIAAHLALKDG
ncbi:hypothetical protein [Nocardiopsis listeri]|uniref:hypothetical protein n=1 Tax=Nocardiopsis listeri TaxID=53440 RepID=UPI00082C9045|nr:hypothetical protein [Nocardiopsis listeri]